MKWVVGVLLTLAGLAAAAFWNILSRFGRVHDRIDKVKDDYVRRDDLDRALQHIDGGLNELRREMRELEKTHAERHRELMDHLTRKSG